MAASVGADRAFVNEYEDLGSEFDPSEKEKRRTYRDDALLGTKLQLSSHAASVPSKQLLVAERDREEWHSRRFHLLSMDAYSRHKMLINHYLLSTGRGIEQFSRSTARDRNDYDVLREEHKFLWDESEKADSWEKRLAKVYYDKLFKEYAISDLTRYKENRIAMRWRTESEVVEGKGQFVCGSKHCSVREGLQSWEVNFGYVEQGQKKNALVKLRLCKDCSRKLNYHHKRKKWSKSATGGGEKLKVSAVGEKRKHRHKKSKAKRHKQDRSSSSSDSSECTGALYDIACFSWLYTDTREDDQESNAVWTKSAKELVERSKEEEYDEYFKDMLV